MLLSFSSYSLRHIRLTLALHSLTFGRQGPMRNVTRQEPGINISHLRAYENRFEVQESLDLGF